MQFNGINLVTGLLNVLPKTKVQCSQEASVWLPVGHMQKYVLRCELNVTYTGGAPNPWWFSKSFAFLTRPESFKL